MNTVKIVFGPFLFVCSLIASSILNTPFTVGAVIGTVIWMIYWWITETVSMSVTALLPMIVFPLTGVMTAKEIAPSYGNPVVFLFMGGFILALALEKWNLHKRIALLIIEKTGSTAKGLLLGIIISTGLISMWISNTATAVMMLPIGISLLNVLESHHEKVVHDNLTKSLLIGIAYAANIGGFATLIGTPPNVVFAAYMAEHHHYTIGFARWMLLGIPLSVSLLLLAWYVLAYILFPLGNHRYTSLKENIKAQKSDLGELVFGEKMVLIVFSLTCIGWISREYIVKLFPTLPLSDTIIALIAAVVLFLLPSKQENGRVLEWKDTQKMPWGILVLFGGGLCMADGLEKQGVIQQISSIFETIHTNPFFIVLLIATLSIFMTELISNVAQVTVMLPVISGIATGLNLPPMLLIVPMTIAASCAFMLPMATPPNAVVFSTGELKVKDMIRSGIIMNLIAVVMITLVAYFLIPIVFN